ncbi:response regulator [Rhodanobacter lindaniclasticus]|uniref:response regulator n=1 Tax=Rhodanobacter lindaniclasticus TaxID=75310 RepID=UPI003CCC67A3
MSGIGFIKRLLGGGHAVEPQHVQTTQGARMLVVDDSPTICAVLGKMLSQDGYHPLKAADGAAAIELARSELPALIFLDVVMPGMNGFSVLRTLRHDPATRDIPIIMISGNQQATEQFYLQRYGADDFMKKPFDRDDVYERIGNLVANGRLPARDTSVAVNTLLSALSAEALDGIPDIAMPDAGTPGIIEPPLPLHRVA